MHKIFKDRTTRLVLLKKYRNQKNHFKVRRKKRHNLKNLKNLLHDVMRLKFAQLSEALVVTNL